MQSFGPVPQGESHCNESGPRPTGEHSVCTAASQRCASGTSVTSAATVQCHHTLGHCIFLKPNLRTFFESFKLFTKYLMLAIPMIK